MTEQEIFEKLQQIISDVLKTVPAESIKMDSNLVGELGADSLDALDVISRAEQEFGMPLRQKLEMLPDSFFAQPTIRAIVDIISAKLAKSGNTIAKPQAPAVQPKQPEIHEALGIFGRIRRLLNKLNGKEKGMRK